MEAKPTYPEAALGFRAWRLEHDRLVSVGYGSVAWRPGVNMAYCWQSSHLPPAPNCQCGLQAFHDLKTASEYLRKGEIVGAVAGKGELEVHTDGWRASEARVIALLAPDKPKHRLWAEQVAQAYGVPLFEERSEFLKYMQGEAKRVPQSLIPFADKPLPATPKASRGEGFRAAVIDWSTNFAVACTLFSLVSVCALVLQWLGWNLWVCATVGGAGVLVAGHVVMLCDKGKPGRRYRNT